MAEQLLKAMSGPDSDGDGISDSLQRLLQDQGFSLGSDNWKNRRRLIFGMTITAWGSCLLMVGIWAWMALFTKQDIPPNLLNFGTTMFWAMNMLATTLALGYAGISQMDTHNYRKQSVDLAKALPAPSNNQGGYGGFGGGGYGGGYGGGRYSPYDSMYVGNNKPGAGEDAENAPATPMGGVAPPTPLAPEGVSRKPGVIL